MAMGKNGVQAVGALLSIGVLAISGLFVAKPLYDDASESKAELSTMQQATADKQAQLTTLENGVDNYDEIQAYVDNFLNSVSSVKDLESASRSISSAAVPGITINSFDFGTEENIEASEVPEAVLGDYTPPAGFDNLASSEGSSSEEGESASADSFHRIPIQIDVTATDYNTLSTYMDNLAQQKRLLNVVSVNSTKNSSSEATEITATIYAYAFVYAR